MSKETKMRNFTGAQLAELTKGKHNLAEPGNTKNSPLITVEKHTAPARRHLQS